MIPHLLFEMRAGRINCHQKQAIAARCADIYQPKEEIAQLVVAMVPEHPRQTALGH